MCDISVFKTDIKTKSYDIQDLLTKNQIDNKLINDKMDTNLFVKHPFNEHNECRTEIEILVKPEDVERSLVIINQYLANYDQIAYDKESDLSVKFRLKKDLIIFSIISFFLVPFPFYVLKLTDPLNKSSLLIKISTLIFSLITLAFGILFISNSYINIILLFVPQVIVISIYIFILSLSVQNNFKSIIMKFPLILVGFSFFVFYLYFSGLIK